MHWSESEVMGRTSVRGTGSSVTDLVTWYTYYLATCQHLQVTLSRTVLFANHQRSDTGTCPQRLFTRRNRSAASDSERKNLMNPVLFARRLKKIKKRKREKKSGKSEVDR